MRVVFEACKGTDLLEVSPPPPAPLIRCLELKGIARGSHVEKYNDKSFISAKEAYEQAIVVADQSSSSRSGASLRIALSSLIARYCDNTDKARELVYPLLDWVVEHPVKFRDLVSNALELKDSLSKEARLRELKAVIDAMSHTDGYDYGGSASSHWYECPNGHPYFIGECGGAMETGRCYQCGVSVGGTSHELLSSNRAVGGSVREALGGR